jgi:hypothetical protein
MGILCAVIFLFFFSFFQHMLQSIAAYKSEQVYIICERCPFLFAGSSKSMGSEVCAIDFARGHHVGYAIVTPQFFFVFFLLLTTIPGSMMGGRF